MGQREQLETVMDSPSNAAAPDISTLTPKPGGKKPFIYRPSSWRLMIANLTIRSLTLIMPRRILQMTWPTGNCYNELIVLKGKCVE